MSLTRGSVVYWGRYRKAIYIMRWIERPIENPTSVQVLSDALNSLPEPLTRFLILRGVDSLDAARDYFRATKEDLHDPHLLADVDLAAEMA